TARRALGEEIEVVTLDGQVPTPVLPDEWRREIFVPCGTLSASLRFYDIFSQLVRAEPASAGSVAQRLTASPEWARFVADPTGDAPLPVATAEQPEVPLAGGSRPASLERELRDSLAAYGGAASTDRLSRLFPGRALSTSLERLRSWGHVTRDASGRWSVSPSGRREALSTPARHLLCRRWAQSETDVG